MKTTELIANMQTVTRQVILQTNYLLQKDPEILLKQPSAGKWSVAQVIEHLNSYGRYYLPKIKETMKRETDTSSPNFTPGWLGDYFTKSMLPKQDGRIVNKMQAPKNHRPSPDIDSKKAIDEFLEQEYLLLQLLDQAGCRDIEKIRISISISRFIRIKPGDALRFLIAHHQRHFVQIQNTLKAVEELSQPQAVLLNNS